MFNNQAERTIIGGGGWSRGKAHDRSPPRSIESSISGGSTKSQFQKYTLDIEDQIVEESGESLPDSPERKISGNVVKGDSRLEIFRSIPKDSERSELYNGNSTVSISTTI